MDSTVFMHRITRRQPTSPPPQLTGGVLVGVKSCIKHAVLDFRAINDLIGGSISCIIFMSRWTYVKWDYHVYILHIKSMCVHAPPPKRLLSSTVRGGMKLDIFMSELSSTDGIVLLGYMNSRIGIETRTHY